MTRRRSGEKEASEKQVGEKVQTGAAATSREQQRPSIDSGGAWAPTATADAPKMSDGVLPAHAEAQQASAGGPAFSRGLAEKKGSLAAVAQEQRFCHVARLRTVVVPGRRGSLGQSWIRSVRDVPQPPLGKGKERGARNWRRKEDAHTHIHANMHPHVYTWIHTVAGKEEKKAGRRWVAELDAIASAHQHQRLSSMLVCILRLNPLSVIASLRCSVVEYVTRTKGEGKGDAGQGEVWHG